MSYLAKSKFGNCDTCSATDVNIVKVGKIKYCLSKCYRELKGQQYIQKSIERDKERRQQYQPLKPIPASEKGSIRKLIKPDKRIESKSQLLAKADKLFADWVKRRDVKSGKYFCPPCNKMHDAEQLDSDGSKVINCGHFVDRAIYSLRFDTDNAHAICSYSNKRQHYTPRGIEYLNFRNYLVGLHGEESVAEMELQHRKINKLELTELKNIIKHYSN